MVIFLGSSNGGTLLWSRGRPGELVRIAQLQPGHVDNLLGMAPEVRNAIEDRRHAGHVDALDASWAVHGYSTCSGMAMNASPARTMIGS